MPDQEYVRNRPRISTTVSDSTLTALSELTRTLNLPTLGVTIDYLIAERTRLLVKTADDSATLPGKLVA